MSAVTIPDAALRLRCSESALLTAVREYPERLPVTFPEDPHAEPTLHTADLERVFGTRWSA